jgi:hypothetical protein
VAPACDFAAEMAFASRVELAESAALAWGTPAVAAVVTATAAALISVTSLRM